MKSWLVGALLVAAPALSQSAFAQAAAPTQAAPPAQAAADAPKNNYADDKTWLCRPGRHDACDVDLNTTVVAPDGKLTREAWTAVYSLMASVMQMGARDMAQAQRDPAMLHQRVA